MRNPLKRALQRLADGDVPERSFPLDELCTEDNDPELTRDMLLSFMRDALEEGEA